ncbi:MAG: N-acetylmuramoyl-L-alanine amidase [Deltaproteobacteria bacterium]|nr:N-acetylmuramoyl-L-alanine amidase [Deltaproteobacteria bacterium]
MRRSLAILVLFAILVPWPRTAGAVVLEQVLVFVGHHHARVLLVLDGAVEDPRTSSAPGVGRAPPRARVLLPGTTASGTLTSAYRPIPGGVEMPVDQGGIAALAIGEVSGGSEVVVTLAEPLAATLLKVGRRALLLDLRSPQASPDPSLPGPDVLARFLNGVGFVRDEAALPGSRPRIVVDAGHGGEDTGAVGPTGTRESDVALGLAKRVADELEHRLGAEVFLTRDADRFVSLQDRAALANGQDADLFLSIHLNAAPTPALWGVETYYLDVASDADAARVARRENASVSGPEDPTSAVVSQLRVSGTSALSRRLAHEVQEAVIRRLSTVFGPDQIRDLGVKSAMFHVLVAARMPAILFEASFLSHPEEELRLRTPAFQRETADAVVEGVGRYLEAVRP